MPTPHDLRRTAATRLAKMGTSKEIRDRVLNHAGARHDTESKHYNMYEFQRKSARRWIGSLRRSARSLSRPPLSRCRRRAAMMLPFQKLLSEMVSRANSQDDLAKRVYLDGDIAHVRRWLDDCRADEIWKSISKEPFNFDDASIFVDCVLELRHSAEEADAINREVPALAARLKHVVAKVHKRAIKKLTNGEISPEQYGELDQRLKESLPSPKIRDPLLSNRSDNRGGRRRTLFCRVLSDLLHHATGKWHDAEVQALCEIAFGRGDVTIDMVRSARRESTRKKRR